MCPITLISSPMHVIYESAKIRMIYNFVWLFGQLQRYPIIIELNRQIQLINLSDSHITVYISYYQKMLNTQNSRNELNCLGYRIYLLEIIGNHINEKIFDTFPYPTSF
jgi:hypothetical protein